MEGMNLSTHNKIDYEEEREMATNRVWIYGVRGNEVIKTTWRNNEVKDDELEAIAKNWKAKYGCTQVFAMMDSKELRDSWLTVVKSRYLRNGLREFIRFEFLDYLKSGDWELAKN